MALGSPSVQIADQLPFDARPAPLYGNIVSVDRLSGTVTIVTYPSSKAQVKRQCLRDGRTPCHYTFKISELPKTQQSRTLWQAIERWLRELEADVQQVNEDACGPRVTFFDEDEALAFNASIGSRVIDPGRRENGRTVAREASKVSSIMMSATHAEEPVVVKKYGHHHQHRRRRSEQSSSLGSEAFPRRAVDVGIVWWTSDLHGRHP